MRGQGQVRVQVDLIASKDEEEEKEDHNEVPLNASSCIKTLHLFVW